MPLPFLTSKECFCAYVVREVSFASRVRSMWSFYLLSGQGPACFIILLLWSFCYYGVSVHRGEIVQFGAHLLLQCEQFEGKEVWISTSFPKNKVFLTFDFFSLLHPLIPLGSIKLVMFAGLVSCLGGILLVSPISQGSSYSKVTHCSTPINQFS